MIVHKNDFEELKNPEKFIYKVFHVYSKGHYTGSSIVAAEDVEKANAYIQTFRDSDPENVRDSWGWYDARESNHHGEFSNTPGILENDIRYRG